MLRLKTRSQFQAVLAGERVASTTHFVLHRNVLPDMRRAAAGSGEPPSDKPAGPGPDTVWLGAMVPKRWARRAVTRNAIKRQIYSVSSEVEFDVPGAAHVVRLRSGFDRKLFVSAVSDPLKIQIRQELVRLFGSIKPAGTLARKSPQAGA
ncbi:MAG: ribonuclease P protein component [Rhodoferax sp.]|nr:ribonuclease P protein component [Rhodoferax sp.]MBP9929709.1 ribonuclease P protein component [Rhodoferax sp.]HQX58453.1 ribonuclease P protein component [Burkholderiaceae bacterium]HQZ07487.1 ribonuclease P protein component [Burkholderiaceae bacterium]HRA61386.1 ribonuclease P protein component [Burkholderiaceae bacterium]